MRCNFLRFKEKISEFSKKWYEIFLNFISTYAVKMDMHILIGSIPYRKKNNKFLNRSILISNSGKIISHYDKINLLMFI